MKKRVVAIILFFAMIISLIACDGDKTNTDKEGAVNDDKEVLFEQSLLELDKNLNRWGGRFFWSPDGNYAIADAMSSNPDCDDSPTIILVDIKNNKLIKLKEGFFVSDPVWTKDSKKVTLDVNNGLEILNIEDQSFAKVSDKGYMPQFSPDNSKLIYMNEGLWIYNVGDKSSIQISKGKYDAAPVWFSDGNRIFYFRDNEKDLGDGAGNEQVLSIIDTTAGNKFEDVNVDMKGKFRAAKWLSIDEKLFIYAGWDDGHAYHILDLSNNELLKDIASEQDYIELADIERKLFKIKGYPTSGLVEVYDYDFQKLADCYIDNDKEYEAANMNLGVTALADDRIVYLHVNLEENKGAIMISYLTDGKQTRITEYGDYSMPFVSPDSKNLAYFQEDHILKIHAVDKLKEFEVVK